MTNATSSFGTLLKIGDGGGTEVFTTIAEVLDIDGPEIELRRAEATNHSSPGGWVERIGTLLDGGQITFMVNFLPQNATQSYSAGLLQDQVNRTKRNFQIVFTDPGTTTWTLPCLVAKFKPAAPVEGVLHSEVTLEVAGQPTLA